MPFRLVPKSSPLDDLELSDGFRLGPGGTGPPNLAQAPKFLIGSVVHCFY